MLSTDPEGPQSINATEWDALAAGYFIMGGCQGAGGALLLALVLRYVVSGPTFDT